MTSSTAQPLRVTCDSFADGTLRFSSTLSGQYSSFTNQVAPLVNVKGIQLARANFVNPLLQLSDNHLVFWYYSGTTAANTVALANLRAVRLLPPWYVPWTGVTQFTKNRYFNSVNELVAALNTAAALNGDLFAMNPYWIAGDVSFSYDANTRRISFTGQQVGRFYCPAAFDDPNIATALAANPILMNSIGGQPLQPYVAGLTMNQRLGFAMSTTGRGRQPAVTTFAGAACSTNTPVANAVAIEADSYPILVGSQNLTILCNQVAGNGADGRGRRNVLATLPFNEPALAVNDITCNPALNPLVKTSTNINQFEFQFRDDFDQPVLFYANNSVQLELLLFYDDSKK
jgi:hypothetical protein